MVDKKGLQTQRGTATTAGGVIGTEVASNMRRYIYKIKTANQYAGANQLTLGYSDDDGVSSTTLDYIEHATQYEMWNDPDVLKEDALPIYIVPAGNKLYAITDNGNVELYYEYEDSE
jgi:hypothetical protein